MKKQFLISILLVILTGLKAQKNIDSLKKFLKNANHDTTRCNILFKIIDLEPSDKICIGYNNQIKKIAENNMNSLELNQTMKNKFLSILSDVLSNSAYYNSNLGKYDESFNDITKALNIQERLKNKKAMVYTIMLLASNYLEQGDTLASINEEERAYKLALQVGDKIQIAKCLKAIGFTLYKKGYINKSNDKINASLKVFKEYHQDVDIADCYEQIALILRDKNKFDESFEYNKLGFDIRTQLNDSIGMSNCLTNIAVNLMLKNDYSGALPYAKRSYIISKNLGLPYLILYTSNALKDIYKNQNQPVLALQMYEEYIKMRDITNNEENRKASIRNQFQVEYDKKVLTDSLRTIEERKINSLELEKQQTQKAGLYIILILVLIVAGFIYNRFQLTRKQKAIIEDHQKEILASIRYAKRIQTTLMPNEMYIQKSLSRLQKK
jgi:hypothetical protein